MFLYTGQALRQAPQRMQYRLSLVFGFLRILVRPLSSRITYISSGPSTSPFCRGPVISELYTVTFCPVPKVDSRGQNSPRSVIEGITFSMPTTTMWVRGQEAERR